MGTIVKLIFWINFYICLFVLAFGFYLFYFPDISDYELIGQEVLADGMLVAGPLVVLYTYMYFIMR